MSRPLTESWAACRAQTREEESPRDEHQKKAVATPGGLEQWRRGPSVGAAVQEGAKDEAPNLGGGVGHVP